MKKITCLITVLICTLSVLYAQERTCATSEPNTKEAADLRFALQSHNYQKVTGVVRTVPVVVHVIASSATSIANISDAQIMSQMTVYNEAFRGVYGGVDTEIEFCLAAIQRVQHPTLWKVVLGSNDVAMRNLSREDAFGYYNVWVVEDLLNPDGSFADGFTRYPKLVNTDPDLDGTIIYHEFFGTSGTAGTNYPEYNEGKVAVHEAGHWLNLIHVFTGGCDDSWTCATTGDCCCDTPPQDGELRVCKKRRNTCKTDNPDERDPVHNYMNYTPDECRFEFTSCQSQRMNLCLDSIRGGAWFTTGDCPPPRYGQSYSEITRDFSITAFPNPSKETVTVRLSVIGKETPFSVDIYDAQGKLVASLATSSVLAVGQNEYRFEAPSPGIYLARVASPWATKTIKLVSLAK